MTLSITIHLKISLTTVLLLAKIPPFLQTIGWPM